MAKRPAPQQRVSVAERKRLKRAHLSVAKAAAGIAATGTKVVEARTHAAENNGELKKKKGKHKNKARAKGGAKVRRAAGGAGGSKDGKAASAGGAPKPNRGSGWRDDSPSLALYHQVVPRPGRQSGMDRLETLTRAISTFAQRKQLGLARKAFEAIGVEGLSPSAYSFSNLLNAHINSGDVPGAEAVLKDMRAAGCVPNVVVYTTLLKGYATSGDVERAEALLSEMVEERPPVWPDTRACNTFLRGCVRVGDIAAAVATFKRMEADWGVS